MPMTGEWQSVLRVAHLTLRIHPNCTLKWKDSIISFEIITPIINDKNAQDLFVPVPIAGLFKTF